MKVLLVLFIFITVIAGTKDSQYDASKKDTKLRKSRGETLENLFNVYDPTFLSYVWPKIKNGVHLSVSHSCWEDMSLFFRDLSEGRAWAYKGKYQYGHCQN